MNERIKELAKQAGEYVNSVYTPPVRSKTPGKIWEDGHIGWHTQFNEKFAELIVKECCSKLVEMGEGWHEFANNPPQGQAHNASGALFAAYRLKEDAVDEIKEHFGVEE